jgi:Tol biopolymer transport system component
MIRISFLRWAPVFALIVCSCSIEMDQVSETPPVENPPLITSTSKFPVTHIPVNWAHLNLTGRLIYLSSMEAGDELTSSIQMLDLVTGEIATILSIPGAWMYYATVSPDAKFLVMSYAPPERSNSSSSRSLYVVPLDGSTDPQALFAPPTPVDRYTQAEWSPDGKYIYYVHYNQDHQPAGQFFEDYDLWRMTHPGGEREKIVEHAFWPRLTPDSARLVYVTLDPATGKNELFVTTSDGSNPERVALSGSQMPEIIDAPIFAPDGQSILFSAPEPERAYQPNLFESLLGIQVVKAHSVPSDWWSVPLTGGVPTQLTNIQTINLFASISPDQKHIASLSGEGLFVMELDGSNLTQLMFDQGVHGTVSWIP